MVQILSLKQGTMHSAGEHWRYTKLRKSFDLLANELMVPMTDSGDASGHQPGMFE